MSVSNPAEAELRELVAKTLEEKGVLGKVKVTKLPSSKIRIMYFQILRHVTTGTAESQRLSST